MTKFSPQLIERFQKHFKEKHHAEVSPAEAELYLDSLADLYLIVTDYPVDSLSARYPARSAAACGADAQAPH